MINTYCHIELTILTLNYEYDEPIAQQLSFNAIIIMAVAVPALLQ